MKNKSSSTVTLMYDCDSSRNPADAFIRRLVQTPAS